jgi:hypothetical protein
MVAAACWADSATSVKQTATVRIGLDRQIRDRRNDELPLYMARSFRDFPLAIRYIS